MEDYGNAQELANYIKTLTYEGSSRAAEDPMEGSSREQQTAPANRGPRAPGYLPNNSEWEDRGQPAATFEDEYKSENEEANRAFLQTPAQRFISPPPLNHRYQSPARLLRPAPRRTLFDMRKEKAPVEPEDEEIPAYCGYASQQANIVEPEEPMLYRRHALQQASMAPTHNTVATTTVSNFKYPDELDWSSFKFKVGTGQELKGPESWTLWHEQLTCSLQGIGWVPEKTICTQGEGKLASAIIANCFFFNAITKGAYGWVKRKQDLVNVGLSVPMGNLYDDFCQELIKTSNVKEEKDESTGITHNAASSSSSTRSRGGQRSGRGRGSATVDCSNMECYRCCKTLRQWRISRPKVVY